MLVADSLTRTRWGKTLFKDLGFCLCYGSLTMLLGGSKPAKETLLDVLAGKAEATRGMVRFEGQPVLGNNDYQRLVARIGAKNDLVPKLTVLENIRRHIPADGVESLAGAALEYFRLKPYADTPCGRLPLHLQRRTVFARLLAVPCPVWLITHSSESLDAEGNELLYTLVSNRCNQEGIVVMAGDKADAVSPNLPVNLDDFV